MVPLAVLNEETKEKLIGLWMDWSLLHFYEETFGETEDSNEYYGEGGEWRLKSLFA